MPATAIRVPLVRARLGRLDDARLAALAAEGDERAFETIYDRHHRALLGFCRHSLGTLDESEDALQQTFLRAHRALLAHGPPDDLRPWLFAIARNRCRSLAAARRAEAPADDVAEPATEGLAPEVERRADLQELVADVGELPEDQRSALVLAELADLPHAEIAAIIDVPVPKVKALVHQARARLIAEREARETPCERVREELADARGGALRRGPLRRHLRRCEPCRIYRAAIAEQRAALRLALPVLPSAGLKAAVLGGISGGGGGTAAAAGAGAAGAGLAEAVGGGSMGVVAKGFATKLAVGAGLAGSAGGGAVAVNEVAERPARPAAAVERPAQRPVAAQAPAAVEPAAPRHARTVVARDELRAAPDRKPRHARTGAKAKAKREAKPRHDAHAPKPLRTPKAHDRAAKKHGRAAKPVPAVFHPDGERGKHGAKRDRAAKPEHASRAPSHGDRSSRNPAHGDEASRAPEREPALEEPSEGALAVPEAAEEDVPALAPDKRRSAKGDPAAQQR
jgi:RNA polymerase sigma factor (sigma-70 family)